MQAPQVTPSPICGEGEGGRGGTSHRDEFLGLEGVGRRGVANRGDQLNDRPYPRSSSTALTIRAPNPLLRTLGKCRAIFPSGAMITAFRCIPMKVLP